MGTCFGEIRRHRCLERNKTVILAFERLMQWGTDVMFHRLDATRNFSKHAVQFVSRGGRKADLNFCGRPLHPVIVFKVQVADYIGDHFNRERVSLFGKGQKHEEITDDVDQTRDASAVAKNCVKRFLFERHCRSIPCNLKPVGNVVVHLFAAESLQMAVDVDALSQLTQFG